ncbi:hypothetical protein M433DRAFT_414553 [Acidomyces richmondensis BFW]|nr:MAG: hypothetical protein FE78DRAFT_221106 [Acidomyces sp. 'richmondensis']KYG48506.1 hypothetical protein M433DRAFT_414553 [Acidomyces richmondensis BFW]
MHRHSDAAAEMRPWRRPNLARLSSALPSAFSHPSSLLPRPLGLERPKLAVGSTAHVRGDGLVSGMELWRTATRQATGQHGDLDGEVAARASLVGRGRGWVWPAGRRASRAEYTLSDNLSCRFFNRRTCQGIQSLYGVAVPRFSRWLGDGVT